MQRLLHFKASEERLFFMVIVCCMIQLSTTMTLRRPKNPKLVDFNLSEPFENTLNRDFSAQSVNFCKKYDENFNCLYCIRDFYLRENVCTRIDFANLIANCNVYNSLTTCLQCDAGFFVSGNNLCSAGNASSNCATFLTASTCSSCKPGFRLDGTNCVQITSTSTIPFCAVSSSGTKCDACLIGYALSEDETKCLSVSSLSSQWDANCEDLAINSGKYCNICREGYFLQNGKCVQTDPTDSCFLPNPDTPSECALCMTGFSMRTRGKCLRNENTIASQKDPVSASASLIQNMMVLIIFSLWINRS